MSIFTKIWNWLTKASSSITLALTKGNEYVNALKKITDSPLVSAIVIATPTTIDDKALKFIKEALQKYVAVKGIAEVTIGELRKDADVFKATATELSAYAAFKYAEYKRIKLSFEQALAGTPVNYDPTIVN